MPILQGSLNVSLRRMAASKFRQRAANRFPRRPDAEKIIKIQKAEL